MLPFLDNITRTIKIDSPYESLIRIVEYYGLPGAVLRRTTGFFEKWMIVGELIVSVLSAQRDESCTGAASWEQDKPMIREENVGLTEIDPDNGLARRILSQ
jgi:hypothetical protein